MQWKWAEMLIRLNMLHRHTMQLLRHRAEVAVVGLQFVNAACTASYYDASCREGRRVMMMMMMPIEQVGLAMYVGQMPEARALRFEGRLADFEWEGRCQLQQLSNRYALMAIPRTFCYHSYISLPHTLCCGSLIS